MENSMLAQTTHKFTDAYASTYINTESKRCKYFESHWLYRCPVQNKGATEGLRVAQI